MSSFYPYAPNSYYARTGLRPLPMLMIGLGVAMLLQASLPGVLFPFWESTFGVDVRGMLEQPAAGSATAHALFKITLIITQIGSFGVVAWLIAIGTGRPWLELGFWRSPRISELVGAVGIMLLALPAIQLTVLDAESFHLPPGLGELERELERIEAVNRQLIEALLSDGLMLSILAVGVVPALMEEFFFRGAVQSTLLRVFPTHAAIWITGIIFSFLHLQAFGFVGRMLLGVLFGYLCLWSGSLWPGILAHFTNNTLNVLGVYALHQGWLPGGNSSDLEDPNLFAALLTGLFATLALRYQHRLAAHPPRPWAAAHETGDDSDHGTEAAHTDPDSLWP